MKRLDIARRRLTMDADLKLRGGQRAKELMPVLRLPKESLGARVDRCEAIPSKRRDRGGRG